MAHPEPPDTEPPDTEPPDTEPPGTGCPRDPTDRMMTAADVADLIGGNVTSSTVVRRYKPWGLPATKVGNQLRFWASDVYAWLRDHPA